MANVNEILNLMQKVRPEEKILVEKAYNFTKKSHKGFKRKSGEPYFVHVFETAKTLASLGMDSTTIVAGLLHDVLEDTNLTEAQLKKEFGSEILKLVNGVTKLGRLKYQGRQRHVESLRKFFIAMIDDIRILIIKLADRLHNVRTLKYVSEEKRYRIAMETIEIHARLADKIGLWKIKGKLEDASFPFAYPEEYKELEKLLLLKASSNQKELSYVTNTLRKELISQKVHIVEISQRAKHKYSTWIKLRRYDMDIDKIYDIVALRVIVNNINDCYRVLGIAHSLWRPIPGRIKDYIATPKPNGYRSLHTTIFTGNGGTVEIQIRTSEMHAEAAYGIAAHFIYKESGGKSWKDSTLKTKMDWINQFKELKKIVDKPSEFMENLKMDLFRDRIFIFTPKGDVVDLPEESCALDFAYTIHSDIGNHAQSAQINGKMSALSTKLKNNDIIKIQVNKNTNPSSKWLDFVKTSIAKKQINHYLKKNSLLAKFRSFAKF